MKRIASINEKILSQPEKAVDFFIAFCKARRKKKKLSAKEIPFAVDLNNLKILSLKPTAKELQKADAILKALHQFGKRLAIKFPAYNQFKKDAIVRALEDEILLFEISRRVLAKTENNLAQTAIILANEIFNQIGLDVISETFARQMLLIYLKSIKEPLNHFNQEIPKPDPFKVHEQYFDRRYFYKEKGLLLPFEAQTSPDHLADYYLQHGEDVLHCKTMKRDAMLEVTIYQSARIENQKLVTHKNTIKDTLYIPQSETGVFFTGLDKEVTNDAALEMPSEEEGIALSNYIEALLRYNTKDAPEFTGRCILHFYRMFRGAFPAFTEEQAEVMTTFLCVQLGVLKLKSAHPEIKI